MNAETETTTKTSDSADCIERHVSLDLRTCKKGDKLLSRHGMELEYVGPSNTEDYPHEVRYPDGSRGTRCDDGYVYRKNRMACDHDIFQIVRG